MTTEHSCNVTQIAPTQLSDKEKLHMLQQLDQYRQWRSLDDKRYCIVCDRLISGRDIKIIGANRENGPLRAACPTADCRSIPMDWILPNDEVLARESRSQFETTPEIASDPAASSATNRLGARLKKFATRFGK